MLYVGLDIHSKNIFMCILDDNGKIMQRVTVQQVDQMLNVLEKLPDRFAVCYEASCGYGHYHELLTPIATVDVHSAKQVQAQIREFGKTPAWTRCRRWNSIGIS